VTQADRRHLKQLCCPSVHGTNGQTLVRFFIQDSWGMRQTRAEAGRPRGLPGGFLAPLLKIHIGKGKSANLSFLAPLVVRTLTMDTALVKSRDQSIDAPNCGDKNPLAMS